MDGDMGPRGDSGASGSPGLPGPEGEPGKGVLLLDRFKCLLISIYFF